MKKLFYFNLACLLMSNVFGQQKICDSIYIDSLAIKDRNFNFVSRNDSKTQIDYPKFHLLSTSGDTLTKLFSATYIIPNYNWTYYVQIKGNLQLPDQVVLHLNSKLIDSVHCEFPIDLKQVITTIHKNKNVIINSLANPIQHNFNIELNETIEGTISVMKASGEQVYKSNIKDNSVKVSLDKSVKAGVYIVSIQSNEGENLLLEKVILE
jgi:hypothetical protein